MKKILISITFWVWIISCASPDVKSAFIPLADSLRKPLPQPTFIAKKESEIATHFGQWIKLDSTVYYGQDMTNAHILGDAIREIKELVETIGADYNHPDMNQSIYYTATEDDIDRLYNDIRDFSSKISKKWTGSYKGQAYAVIILTTKTEVIIGYELI